MQNIKQQFKTQIHSEIKKFAHKGKFTRRLYDMEFDIMEEYHAYDDRQTLDIYKMNSGSKQFKLDLHYVTNIDDTRVHICESNTDFVRDVYKMVQNNIVRQHVR